MGRDRRKGRIDWVAFYYDPIEDATMTFPGPVNGYSALVLLHYLYPQNAQLGLDLYEWRCDSSVGVTPRCRSSSSPTTRSCCDSAVDGARGRRHDHLGPAACGLREPVRAAVLRRRRQPLRLLAG